MRESDHPDHYQVSRAVISVLLGIAALSFIGGSAVGGSPHATVLELTFASVLGAALLLILPWCVWRHARARCPTCHRSLERKGGNTTHSRFPCTACGTVWRSRFVVNYPP